ncbi:MAG: DNA methyltransferase, partial [Chloroflexota bacterium]|nr:DNA methyltransferase [Chloroflexota bacterium]
MTQTTATVDLSQDADFSFLPARRTCGCKNSRLNCLSRQELIPLASTVIDVKPRHRWDEEHPARFIPQVPEKFIKLFSHKGECVLDPFCGSGTTNVVALKLGRSSIGIDVNPKSTALAMQRLAQAATDMFVEPTHHRILTGSMLNVLPSLPDGSIDLIVTSPPYFDVVDYRDSTPEQWGNIHDYATFLHKMEKAFYQMARVLKPDGWMVVVTQDVFKKEAKCPIHADYIVMGRAMGLEVWSTQVYILNYSTGGRLIYGYPTAYYPKNDHEFIVIFRK